METTEQSPAAPIRTHVHHGDGTLPPSYQYLREDGGREPRPRASRPTLVIMWVVIAFVVLSIAGGVTAGIVASHHGGSGQQCFTDVGGTTTCYTSP